MLYSDTVLSSYLNIQSYFIPELFSSIGKRDRAGERVSHSIFIFPSVLKSCVIAYTEGQDKSSSNWTRRLINKLVLKIIIIKLIWKKELLKLSKRREPHTSAVNNISIQWNLRMSLLGGSEFSLYLLVEIMYSTLITHSCLTSITTLLQNPHPHYLHVCDLH